MADCPRPLKTCTATVITEASVAECKNWKCCLPWGASLELKDGCLLYTSGNPPADGEYGSISVVDGCIVSASPVESEVYRGDPCAPVPCPCGSDDDGDSNVCNPSTTSGNLYSCDMTGKPLVKCYINGGDNVSVTGAGTSTNPFVISVSLGSAITAVSTNTGDVIKTSTDGTVAYVDHKTGYNDRIINGMVFDQYGHLSDYSEQSSSGVNAVLGTGGVSATTDQSSGIVTVTLADPVYPKEGEWLLGGYTVEVDSKNIIRNITTEIEIDPETVHWGTKEVTYNSLGSLTDVTETNSLGTYIHTLIEPPEDSSILQHTVEFTLVYASQLLVEIVGKGTQTWVEDLSVRLDGSTIGDSMVVGSTGPFIARYTPAGVYTRGTHTLRIASRTGFDLEQGLSVSIIPVQNDATVSSQTSIG